MSKTYSTRENTVFFMQLIVASLIPVALGIAAYIVRDDLTVALNGAGYGLFLAMGFMVLARTYSESAEEKRVQAAKATIK